VDGLEVLVNPLRCVLCGFPAFANMGEIVVVILALHTDGPSHHLRPYSNLRGCKGCVFLLKCLWVLANGQQATS
jgi:hypothetical protein